MHPAVELFLDAYVEEERGFQEYRAKELARTALATERAFLKLVGEQAGEYIVTGDEVIFGGWNEYALRRALFDQTYWWQLRGKCPRCNEVRWSTTCQTRAEIGRQIHDFTPGYDGHICPPPPLPWRERARLAWRIVREGR